MFKDMCKMLIATGHEDRCGNMVQYTTFSDTQTIPFSRGLALHLFLGRYSVKLSQMGRRRDKQNWQHFMIFYTTARQQGTLVHKVNQYLRFFSLNAHSQSRSFGHPVPPSVHQFIMNHLHQWTVKRVSASTKWLF